MASKRHLRRICEAKAVFADEAMARRILRLKVLAPGEYIEPYHCARCWKIHLGHQPEPWRLRGTRK